MNILKIYIVAALLIFPLINNDSIYAQENKAASKKPQNIILLIGDGMGIAQIQSGMILNHGQLNILQFKNVGFSRTQSASNYITDSGAGATALSTGYKTYNGAIGLKPDSTPGRTILEYAEQYGLATGLVSTSSITHATPASFIAHNVSREHYDEIAQDFLKTDIDVFIGGGLENFAMRKDNKNLVNDLRAKGYKVIFSMDSIKMVTSGKLAGLTAKSHNPSILDGRGDMLPASAKTAIQILSKNKKGFFLMVEGSEIDFGGHANNANYVATELVDFDKAVGEALDFARQNKNTLVIVTADHETGGMSITGGNYDQGTVSARFSTTNHTGVMVPVFAFGPGSELFQGFQENTDIFKKMMQLLGFKPETTHK